MRQKKNKTPPTAADEVPTMKKMNCSAEFDRH